MKILLALDKFKGTLTSLQVASALVQGIQTAAPEVDCEIWPVSDGGQGFLAALTGPLHLELQTLQVQTPQGTSTQAQLGWQPQTNRVLIESCQATGLHLIPPQARRPLQLNSAGVGQLLRAALALNPCEILIGLGSSGTVDGGLGLAHALGYRLLDASGQPLRPLPSELFKLAQILPPHSALFRSPTPITALCDVQNPLFGPQGGIQVYSPQKGATPADLEQLEASLKHWVQVLCRDLPLPLGPSQLAALPGAGAAGGLGLGLKALLGAELRSGAEWLLSASGLEKAMHTADLLITGEGQFDQQSGFGKWPTAVIHAARRLQIPVVLVTGQPLAGPLPEGVKAAYNLLQKQPHAPSSAALSQDALVEIGQDLV